MESAIISRTGLPFMAIEAAPMVGVGHLGRMRNLLRIARGTFMAWRAMGKKPGRPDVLLSTGGYVSVPVTLAAWLRRVPVLIYLPDVRPGKAVQWVARLASRIAITHPSAAEHLPPGKTVLTGYPVREAIREANPDSAASQLGLENLFGASLDGDTKASESHARPILLITGGSQGAQRLNRCIAEAAPALLEAMDIIHICGQANIAEASEARNEIPADLRRRYQVFAYLEEEEMAAALTLADIVLCRAGASTLGEIPAKALPAILVPLPISGGHQYPNAKVLVDEGAALMIDDADLSAAKISALLTELVADRSRLEQMSQAAAGLDHPDAAEAIGRCLLELAGRASETKELRD